MIGGEVVREARKRAGITQRDLADLIGTTQSAVARLESGRHSATLERLEEILKHCGFQLTIGLATYDDSHMLQAEDQLRMTPEERLIDLGRTVDAWQQLLGVTEFDE